MVILAPHSYAGQTVSTRPTVSWFIPDEEPVAMELRLYRRASENDFVLLEKLAMTTTPGIMEASLPVTQPELEPGSLYLWEVVVFCNPNRPSSNLLDRADIEVVAPPASLEAAITQAATAQDQADLYAEAGLWYDALAQAARAENAETTTYRHTLLQTLAELESSAFHRQAFEEITQALVEP